MRARNSPSCFALSALDALNIQLDTSIRHADSRCPGAIDIDAIIAKAKKSES